MITILYFASLREQIGISAEEMKLPDKQTIGSIINILRSRGGAWVDAFGDDAYFLTAVNQEIASPEKHLSDGDEVAFFPPVTGG